MLNENSGQSGNSTTDSKTDSEILQNKGFAVSGHTLHGDPAELVADAADAGKGMS